MIEHLYRFRSVEKLLGEKSELERQEIYFAKPEDLNDPVEGFKDMFWFGDKIVWGNFLRHYLLCLDYTFAIFNIGGEEYKLDNFNIPVWMITNDLPTQAYKDRYKEICKLFFENNIISKLPEGLSSRKKPLRSNEPCLYLRSLHYYALSTIIKVSENFRLIEKRPENERFHRASTKGIIDISKFDINQLEQDHPDIEDIADQFFAIASLTFSQIDLSQQYNNPAFSNLRNRRLIFVEFPEKYLRQLEKIVHPDWYVAAFSASCNNASMWGHYGDNHKGVCLKFKINLIQDKPSIKLHGIIGVGGSKRESAPYYGERDCLFYKVNYEEKYPEIDFFRSMGRLPMPALTGWWYLGEDGEKSCCVENLYENEQKWREKYWDDFQKGISTKLIDWRYEEEYRLILFSGIVDYSDSAYRKLNYRFEDLEGIIFGINMSEQDKLSIIKVVEEKCRQENRKDFKFYQAYYSNKTGKIASAELRLLSFA